MGSIPIKLLLIASLSWWVSGAAAFVHEKMEADEDCDAPACAPVSTSDGPQAPKHKHSPDDCPICRLLATMRAEPGLKFNPPIVHWVQCGVVTLTPHDAPSLVRFTPIHSRGPPVA